MPIKFLLLGGGPAFFFGRGGGGSGNFIFMGVGIFPNMGTHSPQQQATITKSKEVPEIIFRFRSRNPTERKSLKSLDIFGCTPKGPYGNTAF